MAFLQAESVKSTMCHRVVTGDDLRASELTHRFAGPATQAAIRDFQTDSGLSPATGALDEATWKKLVEAYMEAGRASGHPVTDDYNGADQEGFARLQYTIRGGRR